MQHQWLSRCEARSGKPNKTPFALRGGSWNNNENNARVAARLNDINDNNWNNNVGGRLGVFHDFCDRLCR